MRTKKLDDMKTHAATDAGSFLQQEAIDAARNAAQEVRRDAATELVNTALKLYPELDAIDADIAKLTPGGRVDELKKKYADLVARLDRVVAAAEALKANPRADIHGILAGAEPVASQVADEARSDEAAVEPPGATAASEGSASDPETLPTELIARVTEALREKRVLPNKKALTRFGVPAAQYAQLMKHLEENKIVGPSIPGRARKVLVQDGNDDGMNNVKEVDTLRDDSAARDSAPAVGEETPVPQSTAIAMRSAAVPVVKGAEPPIEGRECITSINLGGHEYSQGDKITISRKNNDVVESEVFAFESQLYGEINLSKGEEPHAEKKRILSPTVVFKNSDGHKVSLPFLILSSGIRRGTILVGPGDRRSQHKDFFANMKKSDTSRGSSPSPDATPQPPAGSETKKSSPDTATPSPDAAATAESITPEAKQEAKAWVRDFMKGKVTKMVITVEGDGQEVPAVYYDGKNMTLGRFFDVLESYDEAQFPESFKDLGISGTHVADALGELAGELWKDAGFVKEMLEYLIDLSGEQKTEIVAPAAPAAGPDAAAAAPAPASAAAAPAAAPDTATAATAPAAAPDTATAATAPAAAPDIAPAAPPVPEAKQRTLEALDEKKITAEEPGIMIIKEVKNGRTVILRVAKQGKFVAVDDAGKIIINVEGTEYTVGIDDIRHVEPDPTENPKKYVADTLATRNMTIPGPAQLVTRVEFQVEGTGKMTFEKGTKVRLEVLKDDGYITGKIVGSDGVEHTVTLALGHIENVPEEAPAVAVQPPEPAVEQQPPQAEVQLPALPPEVSLDYITDEGLKELLEMVGKEKLEHAYTRFITNPEDATGMVHRFFDNQSEKNKQKILEKMGYDNWQAFLLAWVNEFSPRVIEATQSMVEDGFARVIRADAEFQQFLAQQNSGNSTWERIKAAMLPGALSGGAGLTTAMIAAYAGSIGTMGIGAAAAGVAMGVSRFIKARKERVKEQALQTAWESAITRLRGMYAEQAKQTGAERMLALVRVSLDKTDVTDPEVLRQQATEMILGQVRTDAEQLHKENTYTMEQLTAGLDRMHVRGFGAGQNAVSEITRRSSFMGSLKEFWNSSNERKRVLKKVGEHYTAIGTAASVGAIIGSTAQSSAFTRWSVRIGAGFVRGLGTGAYGAHEYNKGGNERAIRTLESTWLRQLNDIDSAGEAEVAALKDALERFNPDLHLQDKHAIKEALKAGGMQALIVAGISAGLELSNEIGLTDWIKRLAGVDHRGQRPAASSSSPTKEGGGDTPTERTTVRETAAVESSAPGAPAFPEHLVVPKHAVDHVTYFEDTNAFDADGNRLAAEIEMGGDGNIRSEILGMKLLMRGFGMSEGDITDAYREQLEQWGIRVGDGGETRPFVLHDGAKIQMSFDRSGKPHFNIVAGKGQVSEYNTPRFFDHRNDGLEVEQTAEAPSTETPVEAPPIPQNPKWTERFIDAGDDPQGGHMWHVPEGPIHEGTFIYRGNPNYNVGDDQFQMRAWDEDTGRWLRIAPEDADPSIVDAADTDKNAIVEKLRDGWDISSSITPEPTPAPAAEVHTTGGNGPQETTSRNMGTGSTKRPTITPRSPFTEKEIASAAPPAPASEPRVSVAASSETYTDGADGTPKVVQPAATEALAQEKTATPPTEKSAPETPPAAASVPEGERDVRIYSPEAVTQLVNTIQEVSYDNIYTQFTGSSRVQEYVTNMYYAFQAVEHVLQSRVHKGITDDLVEAAIGAAMKASHVPEDFWRVALGYVDGNSVQTLPDGGSAFRYAGDDGNVCIYYDETKIFTPTQDGVGVMMQDVTNTSASPVRMNIIPQADGRIVLEPPPVS